MGVPKHGKESARTKACKKYKAEGKRELNKSKKAEKIANGTYKKKSKPKTKLMKWNNLIKNTTRSTPVCGDDTVYWGTTKPVKSN